MESDFVEQIEKQAAQARFLLEECERLRSELAAEKVYAERLLLCKKELQEIEEAIDDPRIHNTMTITEWIIETKSLLWFCENVV